MFIVRRCINTSAGVKCRQPKNGKTEPSDLIVNGRTILYGSDDLKNIVTMQSAQQRTEIPKAQCIGGFLACLTRYGAASDCQDIGSSAEQAALPRMCTAFKLSIAPQAHTASDW